MRYAVITDVHANVFALKAALKEIDLLKPDKIICLGDIVGGGAYLKHGGEKLLVLMG